MPNFNIVKEVKPKTTTSTIAVTILARKQKRANHQNSDLFALPLKTKYFLKQVSIDF